MRVQSVREEVANSISHGVGLAAVLAATPLLIKNLAASGNTALTAGAALFAAITSPYTEGNSLL
jgi:hemolysin III